MPHLTKSRYLAGLQCARRLWLGWHAPDLGTPPSASTQGIFDMGTEIGRRARGLFAGGVLVDEKAWEHQQAVERTRRILADAGIGAIFEAAFEHAGVRVRVDVLERLAGGAWGLREVKSSTSVKDEHLHDVAVQRTVLEGAGLRVPSVEVIHVDNTYVRGEGEIDWPRLFKRADVTAAVAAVLPAVPARIEVFHGVLAHGDPPAAEPGAHCSDPHECEFWAHCTRGKPADWVFNLPGRPNRFEALRAAGIERIVDIPDDFPLSALQARVRDALRAGVETVTGDLHRALAPLGPPARYLDFETANPAIPLYPGTRPYQQIPFQWSMHELDARGRVAHRDFLAGGRDDPRREFAESLLAATGADGAPVIVYGAFEAHILQGLTAALPDLGEPIAALCGRLVDLLPIVRRHVYHPAFAGSFSLKAVAPALIPGFGYGDLPEVADGAAASAALLRLAAGSDGAEDARLRTALRAYCQRDTLALVELHRMLQARAA